MSQNYWRDRAYRHRKRARIWREAAYNYLQVLEDNLVLTLDLLEERRYHDLQQFSERSLENLRAAIAKSNAETVLGELGWNVERLDEGDTETGGEDVISRY
jgi:hypothetical protein